MTVIVRDWEPGELYAMVFATPEQWQASKPGIPVTAMELAVYPAGPGDGEPAETHDLELLVRDWQPGELYTVVFATPAQWLAAKPEIPADALQVSVYPIGRG